jgi:hypothetical protein
MRLNAIAHNDFSQGFGTGDLQARFPGQAANETLCHAWRDSGGIRTRIHESTAINLD